MTLGGQAKKGIMKSEQIALVNEACRLLARQEKAEKELSALDAEIVDLSPLHRAIETGNFDEVPEHLRTITHNEVRRQIGFKQRKREIVEAQIRDSERALEITETLRIPHDMTLRAWAEAQRPRA
jgi:hypothetical protein